TTSSQLPRYLASMMNSLLCDFATVTTLDLSSPPASTQASVSEFSTITRTSQPMPSSSLSLSRTATRGEVNRLAATHTVLSASPSPSPSAEHSVMLSSSHSMLSPLRGYTYPAAPESPVITLSSSVQVVPSWVHDCAFIR